MFKRFNVDLEELMHDDPDLNRDMSSSSSENASSALSSSDLSIIARSIASGNRWQSTMSASHHHGTKFDSGCIAPERRCQQGRYPRCPGPRGKPNQTGCKVYIIILKGAHLSVYRPIHSAGRCWPLGQYLSRHIPERARHAVSGLWMHHTCISMAEVE
jgi:hypothetical protein